MQTNPVPTAQANRQHSAKPMRANDFDLVSSGLMAILVLAGCAVLVLFSIWITDTTLIPEADDSYPKTQLVSASASVVEIEFDLPSVEETVALQEPTLQQIVQQVESVELASIATGQGETLGDGASSPRPLGQESLDAAGTESVPTFQRWHLLFAATNQNEFAKQLDSLGIELGAFGGGVQGIDYAGDLSTRISHDHNSQPGTEKRLYFSWSKPSPLARFERALLVKAGVRVAGRQIVKFLPSGLEKQLAHLELNYARSRGVLNVDEIAKTVFQCQMVGESYRFAVIDQRYVGAR